MMSEFWTRTTSMGCDDVGRGSNLPDGGRCEGQGCRACSRAGPCSPPGPRARCLYHVLLRPCLSGPVEMHVWNAARDRCLYTCKVQLVKLRLKTRADKIKTWATRRGDFPSRLEYSSCTWSHHYITQRNISKYLLPNGKPWEKKEEYNTEVEITAGHIYEEE